MRRTLLALILSITMLIPGCTSGSDYEFNGGEPMVTGKAPDFTLIDQNGDEFSLSSTKGNVTVLSFFFANCPDICITSSLNIKFVLDQMGEQNASQVSVVSVTVDPWRDTPAVAASFAENKSSGWPHLTSPDAGDENRTYPDLEGVWGDYLVDLKMVETGDERKYLIDHVLPTYMIDRDHQIRTVWLGTDWDPSMFQQDLEHLVKE